MILNKYGLLIDKGVEIIHLILLMIVKTLASRLLNKQSIFSFAKGKIKAPEATSALRSGQISQV